MRVRFRQRRTPQDGFVLVVFAIMLGTLLGLAGFAVDLGNWYLNAERQQRAADSAALAGAVYLPGDPTSAYTDAVAVLKSNGYSATDATYIGPDPTNAAFMKVTVNRSLQSIFIQLFGIKSFALHRTGIASMDADIRMGSPLNVLGKETGPSWASSPGYSSDYWLTQTNPGKWKSQGDRWEAAKCHAGEDYCSGSTNDEFKAGGRLYNIDIAAGATGYLEVQMYDPEVCTSGCDGGSEGGTPALNTIVTMSTPATDPNGSKVIPACSHTYPPGPQQGWVAICDIFIDGNTYRDGAYKLSVDIPMSPPITWNDTENSYALRAGFKSGSFASPVDLNASKQIEVYADGRMVTSHDPSATLDYYLAFIPSSYAGRNISIQVYDFGETGGQDMAVHWADTGVSPNEPAVCTWTMPTQGISLTPVDGRCKFNFSSISPQMESRVVTIVAPIPSTYVCVQTLPDSCWLKLTAHLSGGYSEGSSMSVGQPGAPVRLYNKAS